MKKLLLLLVIALLSLFFFFDAGQYLTFSFLSEQADTLRQGQQQMPYLFAFGFFIIYAVATALSLPGAVILTLAGGAIFGFWTGLLIVSFASTVGATLAFLVSRYLLRDLIQRRFGDGLKSINDGIDKEGAFYLFTLRLVPIFPFFAINLLMGLTSIKVVTYYLVSQVGMLAGTAVYINAGTQLSQITDISGILSPALLLSFALLGVFPIAAKKAIDAYKTKRLYKQWRKPKKFDRNLIVIGAGAGGLVTSYIGAAVKANVTLIEKHKMGGDCLNYGCVPSKALITAAKSADMMKKASAMGVVSNKPAVDFKAVMKHVESAITNIAPHDSVERYTQLGVDVRIGKAQIIDPWTVEVTDESGECQRLTGERLVLATGAAPFIPDIPGLEEAPYVTSDTIWQHCANLDHAPQHVIVLGGGPIGCELSQAFQRLGSQVVQVEMMDQLMAREDHDVADYVQGALRADGVDVRLNHRAVECQKIDGKNFVCIQDEHGAIHTMPCDMLICAVGRRARLAGYGLESLGIDTDRPLPINEFMQTQFPNIYAVGDLAGSYQFTHVAAHQAWYAAVNGLFGRFKKFKVDYRVIPAVTFVDPEIARVGATERELIAAEVEFEVTRYGIDDLDRAITESTPLTPASGFVKVLTAVGSDRILGVTIVGKHAGELLPEFVLAMKYKLGLNKVLGTIHAYPTWSEANKYVAGEWKRNHAPEKLLSFLQSYFKWRIS